jgi:hypothetical protein
MSKPIIECEVNTCTHWISGNQFGAANIDILNKEENLMAQSDTHTACKTFAKKQGLASLFNSMDNVNWSGVISSIFTEDQQLNPTVTCIVESCHFWTEGNRCEAERIKVTGFGADECQDTNCATFTKSA